MRQFLLFCFLFPALLPAQEPAVPAKNWQVKTNLTGFLSNTISFEGERALNRGFALTLQGGAIINVLDPQPEHVFEGYFFRLGGKKYLFQEGREVANTGLAVKVEAHYSHWRDSRAITRDGTGRRWEKSYGAIATLSYSHTLGRILLIEPYFGIGYLPTWQHYLFRSEYDMEDIIDSYSVKVTKEMRRRSYFTHFSIYGDLCVSAGLSFGLRF